MSPRRTAIVGLSWIGSDRAGDASDPVLGTAIPFSHASAMAAIPDIDVVACCDISSDARERFVEAWSGRWPHLRAYRDYADMLTTERPEIVSVVTPDHLHTEVVVAAIGAGARGIFCEKPLATTLGDADAMIAAARAAGVKMIVNYRRRWMPEYVEARRLIQEGAIGRLSQILAQAGGGERAMLFRNHTHIIDLVCYFADGEPEWVIGELEAGFESYGTEYAGDGGKDPSTEPGANLYVAFRNGVRAFITGMKSTPAGEIILQLIGERGRLILDDEGVRLVIPGGDDLQAKRGGVLVEHVRPRWTVAGMQAALLDLIAAIDGGGTPASTPETARRTVAITKAVLMSQAGGNVPVRLDALAPPALPSA